MEKNKMDVLKEIKKEHDEFRTLISEIEAAKGEKKKALFEELYIKLVGHHESEEHVLFPYVKSKSDEEGQDVVLEMIEEHSLVAYQFSVIQKTGIDNETWDAKFSVLKEILTHHMAEEEDELFKQAKKVLDKKTLLDKYDDFEKTNEKYQKEQEAKLNKLFKFSFY